MCIYIMVYKYKENDGLVIRFYLSNRILLFPFTVYNFFSRLNCSFDLFGKRKDACPI